MDDTGRRARRLRVLSVPVALGSAVVALAAVASITTATARPAPAEVSVLGLRVETGRPFAIDVAAAPARTVERGCSQLEGSVYQDHDLNGARQAEEAAMTGLRVAAFDQAGKLVGETESDARGQWTLRLPEPQLVRLEFSSPDRSMRSAPTGLDSAPFVTFPAQPRCQVDVGVVWSSGQLTDARPAMELGDRAWTDGDCDGLQDPGEPGLAGLTLELQDQSGRLLASTVTSADGQYRFGGLTSGSRYRLVARGAPAELSATTAQVGLVALNPAADPLSDAQHADAVVPYSGADSNGVSAGDLVVADFVAGEAGVSDHSIDFGWAAWVDGAGNGSVPAGPCVRPTQ